MSTIDALKHDILTECEEDHVGLWSIIADAEAAFPKKSAAALRQGVLELIRELLVANEIKAGFPTEKGGFRALRVAPEGIMQRIESEWREGRRPTIGEGIWFSRSKATGRKLKGFVARQGDKRLQKKSGSASTHARHKKPV